MRSTRTWTRLIGIAFVIAGLAFAQGGPPSGEPHGQAKKAEKAKKPKHRGRGLGLTLKMLDLTEQQLVAVRSIFDAAEVQTQPVRDELATKRSDLQGAIRANDVNKIGALATEIGTLEGQLISSKSKAWAEVYTMLTDAQRQKLDDLLDFFGVDD